MLVDILKKETQSIQPNSPTSKKPQRQKFPQAQKVLAKTILILHLVLGPKMAIARFSVFIWRYLKFLDPFLLSLLSFTRQIASLKFSGHFSVLLQLAVLSEHWSFCHFPLRNTALTYSTLKIKDFPLLLFLPECCPVHSEDKESVALVMEVKH